MTPNELTEYIEILANARKNAIQRMYDDCELAADEAAEMTDELEYWVGVAHVQDALYELTWGELGEMADALNLAWNELHNIIWNTPETETNQQAIA